MTGTTTKPVPVVVVGPLPPPQFGVATATRYLQEIAEEEGLPMVFLDTADRRGLANIGRLDLGNVLLAFRHGGQFLWLLASRRPRVVYASLSQGQLGFLRDSLFLVPALLSRRKVVLHLHGGYYRDFYESQPWWIRSLLRWQLGNVSRVVVLGERFRGMLEGIVPAERVVVIPNGVAVGEVEDRLEPVEESVPALRVLYLGKVCRDKGVLDLIAAMGAVRRQVPGVRLTLAGETAAREEQPIRSALRERGLSEAVERVGPVAGEAKGRVLREADVFVFPSCNPLGEGQPFVLLEAMAAGLPVVTTDIGTAAETVVDGVSGLVVPQGAPEAMAAAIVRLLKDGEMRCRMGSAGLERARSLYSLDRWRDGMLAVLSDMAAEG